MAPRERDLARLAKRYVDFAEQQAQPSSPSYHKLCLHVAQSPRLLRFLADLPIARRQPNLFLAAVRSVAGVPASGAKLEEIITRHGARIRQVMLSHSTQTNEPGRCAALLPALASLPQPLALLEVVAAAGLCLLPDKYAYDYGSVKITASNPGPDPAPIFPCRANSQTPLPAHNVEVVWRAGLDLNPLDVRSTEDCAWLETLVWPEHRYRAGRLGAALKVARNDPPPVIQGDLRQDLAALAATAPGDATLVIFHTAVLNYLATAAEREQFAATVGRLDAVWIANEAPGVFPELAKQAPPPPGPELYFLQAVNGTPVAWTGPHGQSIDWFA